MPAVPFPDGRLERKEREEHLEGKSGSIDCHIMDDEIRVGTHTQPGKGSHIGVDALCWPPSCRIWGYCFVDLFTTQPLRFYPPQQDMPLTITQLDPGP